MQKFFCIVIVRSYEEMLKLIDLIALSGVSLENFKIHCATGSNPTPLEAFFDGKFKEWQEHQNQRNFQCDQVVSLIHLGGDKWLFAGLYAVHGVERRTQRKKSWYQYSTSELEGLEHLTGRAIVRFEKKFRASYLRGTKYTENLIVAEVREERMSVGDFPGYNLVLLSYRLLRTIVREDLPSWKSALSNVSGVYLITDTNIGKHYVGSAYGGEGIWQRWVAYAKDGHGGNKELKEILQSNGNEYVHNFQLSVLEVCDLNASKEHIIGREAHWKDVLCSREFGYNKN